MLGDLVMQEQYVFGIINQGKLCNPIEITTLAEATRKLSILANVEVKHNVQDRGQFYMMPKSVYEVLSK